MANDEKNKVAKKEDKAAKKEEKKAKKAAKEKDPELKNTVVKCIAALACVGILSASISGGFGKIADAKKAVLEGGEGEGTAAESAMDDFFADFDMGDDSAAAPAGDGTVAPAGDSTAAGTTDGTAAGTTDGTAAGTTDGTAAGTTGGNTAAQATKVPSTKAEILKVYNDATAKAVKGAVPFQKDRTTSEKKYEAGLALSTFKSIVYKFMGVGDANKFSKTVTAEDKDSYHKYLQASKLTEADITNATCKLSGDNYLITINIKDGSSSVKGGQVVSSNNAPLDRSGLACGADDKDYWDHKPAQNIIAAIDDVPGAAKGDISEKYSNAVINVVINAKTGNIVQLGASFSFTVNIDNVLGSNGVAEAATTVIFKDFKY